MSDALSRAFPGDDHPQGAAEVARDDERRAHIRSEIERNHSENCPCPYCTEPTPTADWEV